MNAYTLAALPPTLLLIARPQLWPWALAVAAFVTIAYLWETRRQARNERDEARYEVSRLEDECNAHAVTNARLTVEAQLTDPGTATTVRVPSLRVVRQSREVSDYEWPAIVRAVEGETGDAS